MSRAATMAREGRFAELAAGAAGGAGWSALERAEAAWELGLGDAARAAAIEARQALLRQGERRELALAYLWIARCEATYFDPQAGLVPLDKARGILNAEGSPAERALLAAVAAECAGSAVPEDGAEDVVWGNWWRVTRAVRALEAGDPGSASQAATEALKDSPADLRWRAHAVLAGAGAEGDHAGQARAELAKILEALPPEAQASFLLRRDRARLRRWVEFPAPAVATDRPARDLRHLSRVIRTMNTEQRIDSLLRVIIDSMIECTGAESGLLVLIEKDRVDLAVRRAMGGRDLAAGETPLSMRIAREVAGSGQASLLADAAADPSWKTVQSVAERGLRSVLCVPLRFRERSMGAVFLENRSRSGAFLAADRELAEVLADQAAIALENALLLAKSIIDPLTGSTTHAHFERRMAEEVERALRLGRPVSLLLVDLDRLKQVNDTHGHDAGSRMIKEAAEVLRRELRLADVTARGGPPTSMVGRFGGDEFEVLLPDTARDGLPAVAQRLLNALREAHVESGGTRIDITASLGGAACPDDAKSAQELFLRADEALYAAKRAGRDRFVAFGGALPAGPADDDTALLTRYGGEVLSMFTQVLAKGEEPQALLDRSLRAIVKVTGAERGFILLYEGKDKIQFRSAFNLRDEEFSPDRFRISFGVVTRLVREGQPLRVNNAARDPQFQGHKSVQELGLNSFTAVPIPGKASPVGLVYLDSTSPKKVFSLEDEKLLLRFADFLSETLGLAAATQQRTLQVAVLQQALSAGLKDLQAQYRFDALIGDSPPIRRVRTTLDHIARFSYPVLVLGETGTGKELVVKAIHGNSSRRDHPIVAVNCAALSRELLESELFGHVKGAFTGADKDRPGLFAAANHGTLFLDEVGEMAEELQRKLLRVLQEGEYIPVGTTTPHKCDVRIVAATHSELEAEVKAGRFREDLYYRLKVFRVSLPPLRDRSEDIPLLALHLLQKALAESGAGKRTLGADALKALQRHLWPGNVRELENAMRHGVAFSTDVIQPEHLPAEVTEAPRVAIAHRALEAFVPSGTGRPVDELWRMLVQKTLEEMGWNQSAAAKELGISRNTLARKMKAFGIEQPG